MRKFYTVVRKGYREGSLIGKERLNPYPGGRNDNILGIEKMIGPRETVKEGDLVFITKYEEKDRYYIAKVGYFWSGEYQKGIEIKELDGRFIVKGGSYRYREYASLEEIASVSPEEAKAVEEYKNDLEREKQREANREQEMMEYRHRAHEESLRKWEQAFELLRTSEEAFKVYDPSGYPYILVNGLRMSLSFYGKELMEYIYYPSMAEVRKHLQKHDKELIDRRIYEEEIKILTGEIDTLNLKEIVAGVSTWAKRISEGWHVLRRYSIHFADGATVDYEAVGVELSPSNLPAYVRKRIARRVKPMLNDPERLDELLEARIKKLGQS